MFYIIEYTAHYGYIVRAVLSGEFGQYLDEGGQILGFGPFSLSGENIMCK